MTSLIPIAMLPTQQSIAKEETVDNNGLLLLKRIPTPFQLATPLNAKLDQLLMDHQTNSQETISFQTLDWIMILSTHMLMINRLKHTVDQVVPDVDNTGQ